jgi:bacterioferritin (cytochrome b1)
MTESALVEERNLNEERKQKMKLFVEAKAEELRTAKNTNDEVRSDLNKTNEALNHVRTKLHHMTEMYDSTSNKNRELIREMARIKKNTQQLHNLGSNLELELHKSAQETEEHKQKRNTAKHELMTMLRKLEAEQSVSEKLRDSIKFTFTPKALSQQQLLNESLNDFETELLKLSRKLGKTLPPKTTTGSNNHEGGEDGHNPEGNGESNDNNNGTNGYDGAGAGASPTKAKKNGKVNSRSEWDTTRLLSNLEHETQSVSREIMAFNSAVERLHVLLDDSGEKTCVSTLNELFNALAAGSAPPVVTSAVDSTNDGQHNLDSYATNLNANFGKGDAGHYEEDEDDAFTGSPVKRRAEQYGLVQPGS